MRVLISTFALILCTTASAATKSGFSCEMIKDEVVRAACIKDKAASMESDNQESVKAESERKRLVDFIKTAQDFVTSDFKDPAGAQFTEMVVANDPSAMALCGKVNGKNSYGGYVGAKPFYVTRTGGNELAKSIIDPPTLPSDKLQTSMFELSMSTRKLVCAGAKPYP